MTKPTAMIVGVGKGLSASLARLLAAEGYDLILAARNIEKIKQLATETNAKSIECDATQPDAVEKLFANLEGPLRVAVCNPSYRQRGPITELDASEVNRALQVTAFASFLVGQASARVMLALEPENGVRGTILFTGASAGVKGFPKSAPFAMGKFAQRGLAQSMARELHPKAIHVAWINVDGGIAPRDENNDRSGDRLDPDAIAREYLRLIQQDPTTWSNELTLRPSVEPF